MKTLMNKVRNGDAYEWIEHADEYSTKLECWRIHYEMNMLTNTVWNEHADEWNTEIRIELEEHVE